MFMCPGIVDNVGGIIGGGGAPIDLGGIPDPGICIGGAPIGIPGKNGGGLGIGPGKEPGGGSVEVGNEGGTARSRFKASCFLISRSIFSVTRISRVQMGKSNLSDRNLRFMIFKDPPMTMYLV
jgi:hypothetical protein